MNLKKILKEEATWCFLALAGLLILLYTGAYVIIDTYFYMISLNILIFKRTSCTNLLQPIVWREIQNIRINSNHNLVSVSIVLKLMDAINIYALKIIRILILATIETDSACCWYYDKYLIFHHSFFLNKPTHRLCKNRHD